MWEFHNYCQGSCPFRTIIGGIEVEPAASLPATGMDLSKIHYSFSVGFNTVSEVIVEVCDA